MPEIVAEIISTISLAIGLIGVFIITLGSLEAFWQYIAYHCFKSNKNQILTTLGSHLILGLDFLVGKDVIDTMLLEAGEKFWYDLTGLVTVVVIRTILTYFLNRELEEVSNGKKHLMA